ncbi:MAG TPA: trehalose-phosphatase [Dokdonella sp.]
MIEERSVEPIAAPPARIDAATTALFVDLDGTVVDFAERPDAVRVEPGVRTALRRLSELLGGALAPISGRPLHEIDALLGLPRTAAAGLHGAELRGPDGRLIDAPRDDARLAAARVRAAARLAQCPGLVLEDKRSALALHYRGAPAFAGEARRLGAELLELAGPGYELLHGNQVVELKPSGSDKGSALAALMRMPPFAGRTPWMLGDDLTDEHAFERADALGGFGILVGARRPTRARRALPDPDAARAWLAALVAAAEAAA